MAEQSDTVFIRRQWNDWKIGKVELNKIKGLHWDTISGGVQAPSPRPFIHGYILCTDIIEGEVSHSCMHGDKPHSIKVCVVKKDNHKNMFEFLKQIVGEPPKPVNLNLKHKKKPAAMRELKIKPAIRNVEEA